MWFVPVRLISATVVRGLAWADGARPRLVELCGDIFEKHATQLDTTRPLEDPPKELRGGDVHGFTSTGVVANPVGGDVG